MGIKVKISEAIENEILRQEIAEGFHSLLLKKKFNLKEILDNFGRGSEAGKKAKENFKNIQKNNNRDDNYNLNPTEVLKLFHSKTNAEQAEIIKTTMQEFLSVFLSGNFLKIAVQQNLDNEELTIHILEYGYGNKTNKVFNQIKEDVFDIYLNVIVAYFFKDKGKDSQITGNKNIDRIILNSLQKALIYDIKRDQIPDWLEVISKTIDDEIKEYFEEQNDVLQEAIIGPRSIVQAVFKFNQPTMDFIKQELDKGLDTREIKKYRSENKAAVAVASAIVRRAAYVFKDLNTGDKVINGILDLIATKLFKDNSTIKYNLITLITKDVTKKIDRLKSGNFAVSKLLGRLVSSGFK